MGAFGVGKSFVVRDTAFEISKESGRVFVEWNKISREKKQEVYEYPEKYFVLIDIRLSEMDETDIAGIPLLDNQRDFLEWKKPFWANLIAKENGAGIIFFDELNLASPLVQSSAYKIIYDRIVGNDKIGDSWGVVGAGNRDGLDRAYTQTMAMPLRDRLSEVELLNPSVEDWGDWAIGKGIDSRIIGFVNFKPSCLSVINLDDEQKQTTARGWERLNTLINNREIDETFKLLCCSAIGEGVAREFIAFCNLKEKFNIEDLIKNPQKLKDIEDISIKYLLLSSVAERYAKKEEGIDFKKIIEISKVLDEIKNAEFVALLWRFCCQYTKNSGLFKDDFMKSDEFELINKYGKYIR